MGCNCCKMLNSYRFKPQEPSTNGYVNEAHSCEHERSKSPTIKISELMDEGYNIIERDGFSGSHDLYNVPEKINVTNVDADSGRPPNFSSNAVLNEKFIVDVKERDDPSSESNSNRQSTHTSSQEKLAIPNDYTINSDEPECIQHQLYGSMQEISLTESATLEVISSSLNLEFSNDIENIQFNGFGNEANHVYDSNKDPPEKAGNEPNSPSNNHNLIESSRLPSLIELMIERNVARGSKKCAIVTNGVHVEDDMDPDVAEALAALAAAIAGEEYEDYEI